MSRLSWRQPLGLLGLLGLLAGVCLLVPTPPSSAGGNDADAASALEHNRRLLERWRSDPQHGDRLQHDLQAFLALPPQQQEKLRRLDRDLDQLKPAERQRLLRVLHRYARWLETLSREDRERLESAQDRKERLAIIRELRDRQWIERLPRRTREELEQLPPAERAKRLAELRRLDKQLKQKWSKPHSVPTHLTELSPQAQRFLRNRLLPVLTPAETKQLHDAEGKPEYLGVLRQLAHKHKVSFPGASERGNAPP